MTTARWTPMLPPADIKQVVTPVVLTCVARLPAKRRNDRLYVPWISIGDVGLIFSVVQCVLLLSRSRALSVGYGRDSITFPFA